MDECAVGPNLALNKKNGMQVSCSKFKMDEESVGRGEGGRGAKDGWSIAMTVYRLPTQLKTLYSSLRSSQFGIESSTSKTTPRATPPEAVSSKNIFNFENVNAHNVFPPPSFHSSSSSTSLSTTTSS